MKVTCCPHYTIKCDAPNFKLSKSHKKILKQVNRYLIHGIKKGDSDHKEEDKGNPEAKDEGKMEASSDQEPSKTNITSEARPSSTESKKKPRSGKGTCFSHKQSECLAHYILLFIFSIMNISGMLISLK